MAACCWLSDRFGTTCLPDGDVAVANCSAADDASVGRRSGVLVLVLCRNCQFLVAIGRGPRHVSAASSTSSTQQASAKHLRQRPHIAICDSGSAAAIQSDVGRKRNVHAWLVSHTIICEN